MDSKATILLGGEGDEVWFRPGERTVWMATGATTGGAMDLAEVTIEPGLNTFDHIHRGNDEALYVLDGHFRFKVGEQLVEASAGAFVFIPRGTPHSWVSVGPESGKILLTITPGGMDGFFRESGEFSARLAAAGLDWQHLNAEMQATIEDIRRRYQYERVGPQLR
jgi:quercetin dioxygenase-like cupin family protein